MAASDDRHATSAAGDRSDNVPGLDERAEGILRFVAQFWAHRSRLLPVDEQKRCATAARLLIASIDGLEPTDPLQLRRDISSLFELRALTVAAFQRFNARVGGSPSQSRQKLKRLHANQAKAIAALRESQRALRHAHASLWTQPAPSVPEVVEIRVPAHPNPIDVERAIGWAVVKSFRQAVSDIEAVDTVLAALRGVEQEIQRGGSTGQRWRLPEPLRFKSLPVTMPIPPPCDADVDYFSVMVAAECLAKRVLPF